MLARRQLHGHGNGGQGGGEKYGNQSLAHHEFLLDMETGHRVGAFRGRLSRLRPDELSLGRARSTAVSAG